MALVRSQPNKAQLKWRSVVNEHEQYIIIKKKIRVFYLVGCIVGK